MRSLRIIAAALLAATGSAAAQSTPDTAAAVEIRKQFLADLDTAQVKFLALANAIPADKYSWRPAPGVRSIGEVFMHVASEFYVFTPMAYGAPRSPVIQQGRESFQKFEAMSTKEDALKHLSDGFAYMRQQLMALDASQLSGTRKLFGGDRTIVETSFIMTADLHEHLGQLIAYARMNGIKPPWSR